MKSALLRALPMQGPKAMLAVVLGALLVNVMLAMCVYRLVMPHDVDVIVQRVTQFVEFVHLVPAAREFDVVQGDSLPPPPPMPQRAPTRATSAAAAPNAAADAGAAGASESNAVAATTAVALPAVSGSALLDQVLAQTAPVAGGGKGAAGAGASGDGHGQGAAGASTLQLRADDVEVNLAPSYRLSPSYPLAALKEGIEGVVTVEFMIDSDGNVREPHILHAEPPALFDAAVMNALPKWKFSPKLINGQPVPRRARQDVVFRLHRQ